MKMLFDRVHGRFEKEVPDMDWWGHCWGCKTCQDCDETVEALIAGEIIELGAENDRDDRSCQDCVPARLA